MATGAWAYQFVKGGDIYFAPDDKAGEKKALQDGEFKAFKILDVAAVSVCCARVMHVSG